MRKTWEKYFMDQTESVKERATCDRLHVGCILVKDNRLISTGYNGSISGHVHCDQVGHLMFEGGCKRVLHAEQNALLSCAKYGIATNGATAYVTHYPCPDCMKSLNQAGIKEIYYKEYYAHRYDNKFDEGMDIFQFSDMEEIVI